MVVSEDGSRFSKTGFMIRFDEAADIIGADASRYIFASSSTSNDVRFGFNLGEEARRKLLAFWNLETFFATYADIDDTKVDLSKLDASTLCPVDRWLLIRTNQFIRVANEYMADYSTRDVVAHFESFVNDISNFYIRVNRGRFWSTENSEDKQNAYAVLFYAIKSITGIMAPIIPFMAEFTWQKFIKRYSAEDSVSVFLTEYPAVEERLDITDDRILADVEKARDMISLGLKLRNEKQIKIRQPLSTMYVSANEGNHNAIETFGAVIMSEMNIGEVKELEDTSALESNFLTVNFKVAGRVLKNRANEVKAFLAELGAERQQELSNAVKAGQNVSLPELELEVEPDVFTLNSKALDNIAIYSNNGEFVALDTTISEELARAGLLRDIVRQCQVFRKEAGFDVSDRIYIAFETESELIKSIIAEKQTQLEGDLLATFETPANVEFTGTIDLDGATVTVLLQRK
jgi:isoleucyl-tRNA synthetase